MPTSSTEGKEWLVPRILAELPGSVLDVGAGAGTYSKLLHAAPAGTKVTALEIYRPYVAEFGLHDIYDRVIVADVRRRKLAGYDVIILGDIIEHMSEEDAAKVWVKARKAARKAVFASIPLGVHPQDAVNGNEHECHVSSWTNEAVHDLGGVVASWTGAVIGAYAVLPLR